MIACCYASLHLGHVQAAPRPPLQLAVTAAGGLGYFAHEVERALADDLRRGGLAIASTPVENALGVTVLLEERPGDRVVIAARVRGHQVDVEGAVESLDALVAELATRVIPLCTELPAEPRHEGPARAVGKPRSPPVEPHGPSAPQPTPSLSTPSQPTPALSTPAPSSPAAPAPLQSTPPPSVSTTTPPLAVPTPAPPQAPEPGSPADPYGPDARVAEPRIERPSFIRGRVVVHTLADPPDSPSGTGAIATQALYATLQRQLHQSIVPLGVGISPLGAAAEEGGRAQARFVVMGRLDSFGLFAAPTGPIARLRIELSVVREGRLILRRAIYAQTPLDGIGVAMAEGKRGRQIDPVYLAVTHALEGELGELSLAFGSEGAR